MPATPRGLEVLVKKASVDPAFRKLLLEKRADAAEEIGLELEPSEVAILNAAPRSLLEATIAQTVVHPLLRPAFLGTVAAVMIAAIGLPALQSCARLHESSRGTSPDRPTRPPNTAEEQVTDPAGLDEKDAQDVPPTRGIQPDRPRNGGAE